MSPSTSKLQILSDDVTAEVKVLDSSANVVAHGIGSLEKRLKDGLYKIRVRVGSEFQERLVALDGELPLQSFKPLRIASPIPMDNTGQSHEYHQDAIKAAWANPAPARGNGSRLLISAREWSPTGSRDHPDPAGSLSLTIPSGERIDFADVATVQKHGDAFAIAVFDVSPGLCFVDLDLPDGGRLRRALHAGKGWATQLYMLFHEARGQRLPNLGEGSVAIAKHPVVHDAETRLVEIALDALTQHRTILSKHMRMLLSGKFEQPLLGLVGAHLLLRDGKPGGAFRTVVKNLTKMLGANHSDVIALKTRLGQAKPVSVTEPPMLRASWDLLVEASASMPNLFAPDSPATEVAKFVVPAGAWFVWQPPGEEEGAAQLEAKLDVVRAYVHAQGRSGPPRILDEAGIQDLSVAQLPNALSDEARSDLSRALGMPRMTLDTFLTRI